MHTRHVNRITLGSTLSCLLEIPDLSNQAIVRLTSLLPLIVVLGWLSFHVCHAHFGAIALPEQNCSCKRGLRMPLIAEHISDQNMGWLVHVMKFPLIGRIDYCYLSVWQNEMTQMIALDFSSNMCNVPMNNIVQGLETLYKINSYYYCCYGLNGTGNMINTLLRNCISYWKGYSRSWECLLLFVSEPWKWSFC